MRFKGVRVDIERAHKMKKELITQRENYYIRSKVKQILIHKYGQLDLLQMYLMY